MCDLIVTYGITILQRVRQGNDALPHDAGNALPAATERRENMRGCVPKATRTAYEKRPKTSKSDGLKPLTATRKMLKNPPSARMAVLYLALSIAETMETDDPLSRDDLETLLIATDLLAGLVWGTRLRRDGKLPHETVVSLSLRLSE